MSTAKKILIMAGGTGGHIMPGLAVAEVLKENGWEVKWLGDPEKMEGRLVPKHGVELMPMVFSGVRGKGVLALLKLPFTLVKACWSARKIIKAMQADVVLGMGGYVSFPGALMARTLNIPVLIHEQNAVMGTANKYIAKFARKVLTAFPNVYDRAVVVGNPVRQALLKMPDPDIRYGQRKGALTVLVIGGSLGAMALNELLPEALSLIPKESRPHIIHQSGEKQLEGLKKRYADKGVEAECLAFINDMAEKLAQADIVVCRAGAMTVSEVACVGVAALFVPLPSAIDDHQTANAAWLSGQNAAFLYAQHTLTPEGLSKILQSITRVTLLEMAKRAKQMAYQHSSKEIALICEALIKR